jgi:hypothetical protein
MSSTLRDATEHTVHSLTDLVGDAMQHIDLPHIDLARVTRRRSSLSPALIVGILAALAVGAVVAMRLMPRRKARAADVGSDVESSDSRKRATSAA